MTPSRAEESQQDTPEARGFRVLNIATGHFFFRYRNVLFPVMFVLMLPILQPRIMWGNLALDQALMVCGMVIALTGELCRLTTIGFEYIERGGKNKQVYASRLVQGGVYGLTRNPMYVGNGLIAIGVTMVAGSPLMYGMVLPFFLFVYQAIIAAEEEYLRKRFGAEYDEYCARVNRFLPSFRGMRQAFAGMTYDWHRAFRRDLSTIAGLAIGLILLPFWRTYFLEGFEAAEAEALSTFLSVLGVLACFAWLSYLKKSKRFFYRPDEFEPACLRRAGRGRQASRP